MGSAVKGSCLQVWWLGLYIKVSQDRRKEQTTLSSTLVQWYEHIEIAHQRHKKMTNVIEMIKIWACFRLWTVTYGVMSNCGQCCAWHTLASDLQHCTMWCMCKIFAKLNRISNSPFHKSTILCVWSLLLSC